MTGTGEPRDVMLRRLRIRATHRGIKEMDIILGRFAEARLHDLDDDALAAFDTLLSENDQDLYQWVTGQQAPPPHMVAILDEISRTSCAPQ